MYITSDSDDHISTNFSLDAKFNQLEDRLAFKIR